MNSGGWWIQPDWSQAREGWFFGLLIATVVITALLSPQRRRRLGLPKFLAAQTALTAVPLAGLFLIRSAQRHAFVEAGHGWWSAMWLSLLWMTIFIVVAQMVVRTLPPTRWWLRDLKRADKEIWKGRLQRWLGLARRG